VWSASRSGDLSGKYYRYGVEVFAPNGRPFRIPAWSVQRVLMPWIVRRGIYRGIRRNQPLG
jgi:hypothetical protein